MRMEFFILRGSTRDWRSFILCQEDFFMYKRKIEKDKERNEIFETIISIGIESVIFSTL